MTPAADGAAGRSDKAEGRTADVHVMGKSDSDVVPMNQPNDAARATEEVGEGRSLTKGNADDQPTPRTQSRNSVSRGLAGVREAARRDKKMRFTALLHHVDGELLRASYESLKRQASPGVDGLTWSAYEERSEERLADLLRRIHSGAYRALPSRRVFIPKADGRLRPLGVAALEDKIVQGALVTVLSAIYEEDFAGFSYGFRPGRGQHDCLDALWVGLSRKRMNWVLDADIRGFFDAIDHGWMMKFLEHRIADCRVLRLVAKWLQAGVVDGGVRTETCRGTPQGAVISPLLANVYLHYVLDWWTKHWRSRNAFGDVVIVRYADDFVLGFESKRDAMRYLAEMKERLRSFGLELHPEKTRLIEFGRFAAEDRARRGDGRPETFDFLGFTHYCGRTRTGKPFIWRRTVAKRWAAKVREVAETLMKRRHEPLPTVGAWLRGVVQGYLNYHAIPGNCRRMSAFRREVERAWLRAIRRRSQRHCATWQWFAQVARRWLPPTQILHPYPNARFDAKHPR